MLEVVLEVGQGGEGLGAEIPAGVEIWGVEVSFLARMEQEGRRRRKYRQKKGSVEKVRDMIAVGFKRRDGIVNIE